MEGEDSHTNISHELDAWLPRAAMRFTTSQHTTIPPTPRFSLHKKGTTDRTPTPLPNPIYQAPKATPVQGAIIALGIVCGLLIFGILLFMLLFCHYRKKKMEHQVVNRPPFLPRPFPQAGPRSRMNDDPRNLEQQQHAPEMPIGSRDIHSAAAQRQGRFSVLSGRQSRTKGDDIEAAQRQRAFSAQSGRQSQMQPGDLESAAAAQRQREFSAQSPRRSQIHDGMDMEAVAALAQRQRGLSAQSIRRSKLQEDIDLDTAAAQRERAFSAQSPRHSQLHGGDLQPDMYGIYGSGLGGAQGLPPMMTPQPFHHGDGFQAPMPDPVQTQRSGYSVEDHHSDGEARRNSRILPGHPPPVSRQSRHSGPGDLGGRRGVS